MITNVDHGTFGPKSPHPVHVTVVQNATVLGTGYKCRWKKHFPVQDNAISCYMIAMQFCLGLTVPTATASTHMTVLAEGRTSVRASLRATEEAMAAKKTSVLRQNQSSRVQWASSVVVESLERWFYRCV